MVANAFPLTVPEVARITRVQDKTVRRWMHQGSSGRRLDYRKLPNGTYLIPITALADFLGFDVTQASCPEILDKSVQP